MKIFCLFLVIFAAQSARADIATLLDGCGSAKTCFKFPSGCSDLTDCKVVATALLKVIPRGTDEMIFELYAASNASFIDIQTPRYVSLGFSFDDQIGSDLMNEYVVTFPYNPLQVFKSFNFHGTTTREETNDIEIQETFRDGSVIYVKYQTFLGMSISGIGYDFEQPLYLIMQAGTSVKDDTVGEPDLLSPQISSKPVVLTKDTTIL